MAPSMAEFYIENCIDPGNPQQFDDWLRADVARGEVLAEQDVCEEMKESGPDGHHAARVEIQSSAGSTLCPKGLPNSILEECGTVGYMRQCQNLREWTIANKDLLPISMLLKLLERHQRNLPPAMVEELRRLVELYEANANWINNNLHSAESEEEKARVRTVRIYEQAESIRLDRERARTVQPSVQPKRKPVVRAARNAKNRISFMKYKRKKHEGRITSYFTFLNKLRKQRDARKLGRRVHV